MAKTKGFLLFIIGVITILASGCAPSGAPNIPIQNASMASPTPGITPGALHEPTIFPTQSADAGAAPPDALTSVEIDSEGPTSEGLTEREKLAIVDERLAALSNANIAFNTPEKILLGERFDVLLILSPLLEKEILSGMVVESLDNGEDQKVETAEIRVSTIMEAKLSGSAFEINPITSQKQAISYDEETRWRWEVKALEDGEHSLDLSLTAYIRLDDQETPRTIETFHRTIRIDVKTSAKVGIFLRENAGWLWIIFALPIGGWAIIKYRKKRIVKKPKSDYTDQAISDIFISYSSDDRERVEIYVNKFEEWGWSVWWAPEITPGKSFDDEIEKMLDAAKCVVVFWSKTSVESDWVRTEAGEGKAREILIPVLIDDVEIPLAFRRKETVLLQDWDGVSDHPELELLKEALSKLAGSPTSAQVTN